VGDDKTTTLAGFARLHGVHRSAVTGWKKRGYLAFTADGAVDIAVSNKRLADRPEINRGGVAKVRPLVNGAPVETPSDPESWTLAEATRQERIAAAKLRQLELARAAGKVTDNAEAAEKLRQRLTIVRARMLAITSRIAARLAVLNTAEACAELLDGEIRLALTELSSI
jgi:hypothetical protein